MRLLIALAIAITATPGLAQLAADEDAVRALELRQRDAVVAGNILALERIWSPAYVVNSPGNIVNPRAEVLSRVRQALISYRAYDVSIERITFSGDLAIVMGAERVTPKGGPEAGKVVNRRFTDIWRRDGETWLGIARHANVMVPLPQRPSPTP